MGEETEASVRLTKQDTAGAGSTKSAGRTKGAGRGTSAGDTKQDAADGAPSKPAIPRSIDLVIAAVAAEIVCCLVRALSLRGYTGELTAWLIDANKNADKPQKPYTAVDVAHDLSQLRSGALLQGIVVSLLFALLAAMLRRRSGGAGAARWGLIAVMILTSGPFAVMPVSGWPAVPKVAGVLMGVFCIVAIVLLLVPSSMQYFRDLRAASRPAAAARPAQQGRPAGMGFGSLFGPRARGGGGLFGPRLPQTGGSAREPSAASDSGGAPDANGADGARGASTAARSKSKAKLRTDEAAVARGASLARSRAKASKSRRTET